MARSERPGIVAQRLYERYVTGTDFTPPATYAELLLFVEMSGAPVYFQEDAPEDFDGIQIGGVVYVSGTAQFSDRERMKILAHEWCHWLRRNVAQPTARLYRSPGLAEFRHLEERIAVAFESLF